MELTVDRVAWLFLVCCAWVRRCLKHYLYFLARCCLYPWHRSFALLVSAAGSPIKIIDETWEDLVTKKILTSEEAAGIGLAISLYRLLGDKAGLAAAIKPNVTSRPG